MKCLSDKLGQNAAASIEARTFKDRQGAEEDLRVAMKKQVQMRMEQKAIKRYTLDVARKANFFMQTIAGARKMLQRDRIWRR